MPSYHFYLPSNYTDVWPAESSGTPLWNCHLHWHTTSRSLRNELWLTSQFAGWLDNISFTIYNPHPVVSASFLFTAILADDAFSTSAHRDDVAIEILSWSPYSLQCLFLLRGARYEIVSRSNSNTNGAFYLRPTHAWGKMIFIVLKCLCISFLRAMMPAERLFGF